MSSIGTVNPFFTPTQISGCTFWLDAADPSTLFQDTAGTIPVTNQGQTVACWRDKSSSGLRATTYNAAPRFAINNGLPSVSFNNQGLQSGTVPAGQVDTTGITYIAVATTTSLVTNQQIAFGSTSPEKILRYDPIYSLYTINNGTIRGSQNNYTNGILLFTDTANAMNAFVNGTNTFSTSSSVTYQAQTTSTTYFLGRWSINSAYFIGYTNEAIVYNFVLSTAQRQQVEGYLAWKWGLQGSLPANHPYKTSPIPPLLSPPTSLPSTVQNLQATFLPYQISGCALWLDGADISALGLSGANVIQWNDKSGNRRNATIQAGSTGNPTLVAPSLNGNQSLYFSGTQALTGSLPLNTNTATFIGVTNFTGGNIYGRVITIGNGTIYDGTDLNAALPIIREDSAIASYRNNVRYTLTSITPGTPFLAVSLYTGASNIMYLNGGTGSGSAFSFTLNTGSYTVACDNSNAGYMGYMTGNIGELLVYSNALTTSQRQQVEGYLAWKWGLQTLLPVIHPYKIGPPYSARITAPSRSLAQSGSWLPSQISGMQFWLDAADRNSLTLVGNAVSQINDKSGNSYNATQTTAGSRPSYSKNTITFANNTYLDFPQAAINNTTRYAIFLVFLPIASVNWIIQKQYNGVGSYNMLSMTNFWQNNTGITNYLYWAPHANTGVLNAGTALSLNTLQLIEVLFDGTTLTFYRNGTLLNTVTSGATLTIVNQLSATNCTIGSWRPDGGIQNSGVTNFQFNEFNYYNVALTTIQRQQVEGYLAWKWGLVSSLPATHPFKRWPPSP